jgi:rhamnosyltransferase subunit B
MSRIIFTTIGSLGDLHPQIAIALELRQRGHDIAFTIPQQYRDRIESLGFEFHCLRPEGFAFNDPEEMARMVDVKTGTEYLIRQGILPSLPNTYTDLMDSAKNADFIIAGSVVYAAGLVAEKLGIRWASCPLQPLSLLSAYDPSVLVALPFLIKFRGWGPLFNRGILQLFAAVTKSWSAPIHQLRKELQLPPLSGNLLSNESPYLVLALFSSVLAKPQPDWPKKAIATGFTFYDGAENTVGVIRLRSSQVASPLENRFPPELQQFLDSGEPPIVFTLGSAAVVVPGTFYQESIQAVSQLNRRAVLLIGNNPPPDRLSEDIIAIDYVPYSQIFPRACAIVHQGGIGTTAQALRAGCPTLVVPYSQDQPDNAARVERLGTSRTIDRQQYTAARIVRELTELLKNPDCTTKAAAIGRIIRSEDGVKVACDAIEQQLKFNNLNC